MPKKKRHAKLQKDNNKRKKSTQESESTSAEDARDESEERILEEDNGQKGNKRINVSKRGKRAKLQEDNDKGEKSTQERRENESILGGGIRDELEKQISEGEMKNKRRGEDTPASYKIALLDIEGTTTPISFVHECLFPYVLNNLTNFLNENWTEPELQEHIRLLRDQASKDSSENKDFEYLIPEETTSTEQVKESVIKNIQWQMGIDRKIGALKGFQGYMWRSGYASGELKGVVYDDVVPALNKWRQSGIGIYIYSSGSVEAQKLIFGHSDKGDLLECFSGHFDTSIGAKVTSQSYTDISKEIGVEPGDILFLSDNVKEIIAAKNAGLQTAIALRPGNAPLTEEDSRNNLVVSNFMQLF